MSTGRPPGKVSSSLPWWQTYAKSLEREKKKQEGGRWNKCSMTRGYRLSRRKDIPRDDNECGWEGNEVKVEDEFDFGTHKHLEATAHNTFPLMQRIVQMFRGLAQMFESTYMPTDSSFFAMGLFEMVRWFRGLITGQLVNDTRTSPVRQEAPLQTLTPRHPPKSRSSSSSSPYSAFPSSRTVSFKVSARLPAPNQLLNEHIIDPSKLVFARADFAFNTKDSVELVSREGEIVAILGTAELGVEGAWWRGRTRDGKEGWFPSDYE
ncbi:hypothetical protein BU17DRAFT_69671 [Hysterangium stoloniferum]|nr:hypothetical protein BU17DRAFT_69671 [Hysterangium stoloniferum]